MSMRLPGIFVVLIGLITLTVSIYTYWSCSNVYHLVYSTHERIDHQNQLIQLVADKLDKISIQVNDLSRKYSKNACKTTTKSNVQSHKLTTKSNDQSRKPTINSNDQSRKSTTNSNDQSLATNSNVQSHKPTTNSNDQSLTTNSNDQSQKNAIDATLSSYLGISDPKTQSALVSQISKLPNQKPISSSIENLAMRAITLSYQLGKYPLTVFGEGRGGSFSRFYIQEYLNYILSKFDMGKKLICLEFTPLQYCKSHPKIRDMCQACIDLKYECQSRQIQITENTKGDVPFCADAHDTNRMNQLEGKLDFILYTQVLEHLHSPSIATKNVYNALKVGGYAIVTFPFMEHEHGIPYDFHRYTLSKVELLAKEAGFCILDARKTGNILGSTLGFFGYGMNDISKEHLLYDQSRSEYYYGGAMLWKKTDGKC